MKPENHQIEIMEKFFEENFNKIDQLGLWLQVKEYATFKTMQLITEKEEFEKSVKNAEKNLQCVLCGATPDMDGGMVLFQGTSWCNYCLDNYLGEMAHKKSLFVQWVKKKREELDKDMRVDNK